MQELIKQLAIYGQGLARKNFEKILVEAIEDHNHFSRRTLDKFIS